MKDFAKRDKVVKLELTEDEIHYLEELYVPHALAGVMAQNKLESAKEKICNKNGGSQT